MIDLSPMKGIRVDPSRRTATVEPGLTWAELNRETQLFGLAVTGGGAFNYWKSCFVKMLDNRVIDAWIGQYARSKGSLSGLILEHIHGEAARREIGETAFPLRTDGYSALIVSQWTDPAETEDGVAWGRSTYAAMEPFKHTSRYVNYLDAHESADSHALAEVYGPNYARLQRIKAQYDPENLFHMNQNIQPAEPAT